MRNRGKRNDGTRSELSTRGSRQLIRRPYNRYVRKTGFPDGL